MSSALVAPGQRKRKRTDDEQGPTTNNRHLLDSGKFSDLIIECKGERFNIHKAIICPQRSFCERASEGGFRESVEGVIRLPEDDPATVWRMLQFFTNSYEAKDANYIDDDFVIKVEREDDTDSSMTSGLASTPGASAPAPAASESVSTRRRSGKPVPKIPRSRLMNHIEVLKLAHKYALSKLMREAKSNIKELLSYWNTSDIHFLDGMKEAFAHHHLDLHDSFADACVKRNTLLDSEYARVPRTKAKQEAFWDLVNDEPEIASKALVSAYKEFKRLKLQASEIHAGYRIRLAELDGRVEELDEVVEALKKTWKSTRRRQRQCHNLY